MRVLAARRTPPDRGYPFLALMALLVAVVSPVVSLGGTQPLLLGARARGADGLLPVARAAAAAAGPRRRAAARRGAGGRAAAGRGRRPRRAVVRLQGVRREPRAGRPGALLVGAAVRADRLAARRQRGPARQVRPSRTTGRRRNLELFDGSAFTDAGPLERGGSDPTTDLREDWRDRPGQFDDIEVSIRRMRSTDVIGAGTIMKIEDATRLVHPSGEPGRWNASERAAPRRLLHGRGVRADAHRGRAAGRRHDRPARYRARRISS